MESASSGPPRPNAPSPQLSTYNECPASSASSSLELNLGAASSSSSQPLASCSPQQSSAAGSSSQPLAGPSSSSLTQHLSAAGSSSSSRQPRTAETASSYLPLLNTAAGPSSVPDTPTASSSSPQLLGILNTPPRPARPHPYQRQLSSSKVSELQPAPLKTQTVKPSIMIATPMVMPISDQRPTPILQNVVGTANLGCLLDLVDINFRTRNSEYNPQRFSGIVMRIRDPHTTSLMFHSGKMVVTGAKSEAACLLASRKFARICQKLGNNVKFHGFRVTNMVATCDLKFPIRVENLNMMHGQFSSYEPELFPGLVYRMVCPRVVVLVFVNGKLCFTGAKSVDELNLALENIYPILKSFRKQ